MAKSKYASVLDKLRPEQVPQTPRQVRLDQLKVELRAAGLTDPSRIAVEYGHLRMQKELLEESMSALQERLDVHERMLIESFENDEAGWGQYGANQHTLRIANGASASVHYEPQAGVVDKTAFRRWCVENGLEDALQLWPATTQAMTKERLLAGKPEPAGVEVYLRKKVVWRKPGAE